MHVKLATMLAAASLFIGARAAQADDGIALYQATWAGLDAARIRIVRHNDPGDYRVEMTVSTVGLPWTLSHFRSSSTVEGRLAAGQPPTPIRYDANYDLRKRRSRELRMNFVARDGAVFAERGPGDTSRKPELAEKFRRDVVDPMSAMIAIQTRLRRGETAFTVPVYDGARRFDAEVKVLPRDPKDPGIHLAVMLHAIAGFKGESSDDGDPDDAPRPVAITLSDDARLTPLSMTVRIWFLPLDVTLAHLCVNGEPCNW